MGLDTKNGCAASTPVQHYAYGPIHGLQARQTLSTARDVQAWAAFILRSVPLLDVIGGGNHAGTFLPLLPRIRSAGILPSLSQKRRTPTPISRTDTLFTRG